MKKIIAMILALTLCLGLAACGSSETAAPTETKAAETVAPATEAPATEAATEEVKTLSGKVTVYMPSPAGLADKLAAGFTAATGVEVEQFQGTTGEILARLEAEEANPVADVGILVAGVDYNAYSSMNKGEPLNIYYPAGGTVVNPRPAMILKTAPNMDNAKAFIDYLFSDEAQQLVANAYLLPGRSDIQCDNRTNLADIPQIECDWDKMMEIASDSAAKINDICG